MEIIDQVITTISENSGCRSSDILANALASACSSAYSISMLDVSVSLDRQNKQLVYQLANISQEADYSNADQGNALAWLRKNKYIK